MTSSTADTDEIPVLDSGKDVRRRDFIASAALTGAGALAAASFLLSKDPKPIPERASDPVKVGFIGVGSRGGALLRCMLNVPGSRVVAVADVSEEAQQAAKENILDSQKAQGEEKSDPFASDDYREVLKRDDVEAVVIATPHFMHGPMAMDALEAGKHVYCEKAMAFTIGECMDLHRMARAREKTQVFQVGHQRHYSKFYRKVRDLIHQGAIGNITAIRAQWNQNSNGTRPVLDPRTERMVNWRLYSEYSGGLMTEFASHQIDVANMVLGSPATSPGGAHRVAFPIEVCGMGGIDHPRYRKQKGRDTTDNVHVIFTYRVPYRERGKEVDGKQEWIETGEYYNVRFTYMSIMTNSLLGPSEMIFGDEGTFECSLAGGDYWREAKAQSSGVVGGAAKKAALKSGATISAVKKGIKKSDEEILPAKDRTDWTDFVKVTGEQSPQETLLALDGFLRDIRLCKAGKPFHVAANADVGLGGAASAIMGNIAMKERRVVTWKEFGLPDPT
jgi:predicted dehydrogenase